jgi:hypothetical protein
MTNPAQDAMQHNADMVTNAIVTHFAVPAVVAIILIGLVVIALQILKSAFRRLTKGVGKRSQRH